MSMCVCVCQYLIYMQWLLCSIDALLESYINI